MDDEFAATVRSLYDTLKLSMATVESLARESAEIANVVERDGHQGMADVLRHFGRAHRIKALGLAGKLALLEEQYRSLLRPEV